MYIPIKSASGITLVTLETRLLMERKIYLEGEINEASAASFQQQMQYLALEDPHKPVHLYLNSNGGQVNAGLRIYDILKGTGLELTIWCTGMAASMAAILLAGGPKGRRFILPHSQVMIHEPLISGGGVFLRRIRAVGVLSMAAELQDANTAAFYDTLLSILRTHLGDTCLLSTS